MWTSRLDYAANLLSTGPGIAALIVLAMLFLASFIRPGRWLVVSLVLFSSMFSFNTDRSTMLAPLIAPLSQIRYSAEVLTVLLLSFLTIPALFVQTGQMRTAILAASVAFWVLEVFYSARVSGSVEMGKALASIIIYTALVVVFAWGIPNWLRRRADVYSVIRCMGLAAILFVATTGLQLAINPAAVVRGGRLFAITSNPQYAAMVLAISLIPVVFLVASPHEKWMLRVAWGATAGMVIVLMIWTGSRTGALMALIGIAMMFRKRLGRLVAAGILVAIFVFAFMAIFQVSSGTSSRLVSTLDTRSAGWSGMFNQFKSSPLIGTVSEIDFGTVENSYLTVAGRTGLIGLALLAIVLVLVGLAVRRMIRISTATRSAEYIMMADFVTAGIASIFAGAFFEGILVGTLTFMLLALYLFLGLLKFLSDANAFHIISGGIAHQDTIQEAYEQAWMSGDEDPFDQFHEPLVDPNGRVF